MRACSVLNARGSVSREDGRAIGLRTRKKKEIAVDLCCSCFREYRPLTIMRQAMQLAVNTTRLTNFGALAGHEAPAHKVAHDANTCTPTQLSEKSGCSNEAGLGLICTYIPVLFAVVAFPIVVHIVVLPACPCGPPRLRRPPIWWHIDATVRISLHTTVRFGGVTGTCMVMAYIVIAYIGLYSHGLYSYGVYSL